MPFKVALQIAGKIAQRPIIGDQDPLDPGGPRRVSGNRAAIRAPAMAEGRPATGSAAAQARPAGPCRGVSAFYGGPQALRAFCLGSPGKKPVNLPDPGPGPLMRAVTLQPGPPRRPFSGCRPRVIQGRKPFCRLLQRPVVDFAGVCHGRGRLILERQTMQPCSISRRRQWSISRPCATFTRKARGLPNARPGRPFSAPHKRILGQLLALRFLAEPSSQSLCSR